MTLTIDATNHGGLFSGVIQNGSGTLTLVMIGTGTEGLLNNNTYSGTTTISSGTLQISNGGTSGSVGTGSVIDNATLDFVLASNVTVANVISGSGNLIQEFTGTTTLTGANTYTGTTTITKGTLQVNGSLASGSAVTIASAGTLGGSGTVGGTVAANSGGTLSPGDDPGILGTGSLTLSSGSSFNAEIGGNTAGDGSSYYSQDDVTGTVSLGVRHSQPEQLRQLRAPERRRLRAHQQRRQRRGQRHLRGRHGHRRRVLWDGFARGPGTEQQLPGQRSDGDHHLQGRRRQ